MLDHHPELLNEIETMVSDGVTSFEIRRWAKEIVTDEALPVQRCFNAARWVEAGEQ